MHRLDQVADVQDADDVVERLAVDRDSACTATRARPSAPLPPAARSRSRPLPAAAPSRPRPPCRRSRRPCRASPAPRARSRPGRQRTRAACAARPPNAPRARRRAARARARAGGTTVDSCSSQMSGAEDDEEDAHRRRHRQRGPLGVAERDPLRHELADHDVQVGDDQQRDDHGEDRRHHGVETGARAPARRARRSRGSEIVTPSCIAAMNRGGLLVIRSTAARGGCPRARAPGCGSGET